MASKKKNLEELVKGKGLDALRPSIPSINDDTEDLEAQSQNIGEESADSEKTNKLTGPNREGIIVRIDPGAEELDEINGFVEGKTEYAVVWDAFITSEKKVTSALRKQSRIVFNINCAVSQLLVELKARYEISVICHRLQCFQLEHLYCFTKKRMLGWPYFRASFATEALLPGLFNYQVILNIEDTNVFHVWQAKAFKIY